MSVNLFESAARRILARCDLVRSKSPDSVDIETILNVLNELMTCVEAITKAIKPEIRHDIAQYLHPRWKNIISPITTDLSTITPAATALSTITPPTTALSTTTPAATALSTTTPAATALSTITPPTTSPSTTARTALAANPSDHVSKPPRKRRKLRKRKVDLPITINPLILDNLDTWASSPQGFFNQKRIEAKEECLWTYILALSESDVFNLVRLRYVKLKLYRYWINWKHDGGTTATFLQHLKDRGISLDPKEFEKWMTEAFTYDIFVRTWEEGSLIATDLTVTEARQFPRNAYEAELDKHRKRGIEELSKDCRDTGIAFSIFLDQIPLLDNFIPNNFTTQQTILKRKPRQTLTRPNRLAFRIDKTLVRYPPQTEHASSPVITEIRNLVEGGEVIPGSLTTRGPRGYEGSQPDVGNPQQLSPTPTVHSEPLQGTAMPTSDAEPSTTWHLQTRDLLPSHRRYQSVPLPTTPSHTTRVSQLTPALASPPRSTLNNQVSPPAIQTLPNSPVIQNHIPGSPSLGYRAGSWDGLRIQTPSPGLQPNQQSEASTVRQPVLSSSGPRGKANATTNDIGPGSMQDSSMQGLPLIQSHRHGLSHGAAETHHPHQNCSPPQPPTSQMASDSTVTQRQVARASSSGVSPESNQVMAQEPSSSPPSYQRSKACIPSHPAPPASPDINSAPAEQGQLRPGTTPPIPMAAETTGVLTGISRNRSSLSEFRPDNAESQDRGETNALSGYPHAQALQDRASTGANVNPHSTRNSAMTQDSSSPQPRSSASDVSKEGVPINTGPSPGPQLENMTFDGHCLPNEASRNSAFPQGPQNDVPGSHPSQWSPQRITIGSFLDPLSSSQHIPSTQQQWWALEPRLPDEFTDPRSNDAFPEPGASSNMDTALDTSIDWDAVSRDLLSQIPDTLGKEVFESLGNAAPL